MERCVNCGRKIPVGLEIKLCPKCSSCETIYEAQKVRLWREIQSSVWIGALLAIMATALIFLTDFKYSDLAGTILYIYAAASVGFSAANSVAGYIRLRAAVKKEKETVLKVVADTTGNTLK